MKPSAINNKMGTAKQRTKHSGKESLNKEVEPTLLHKGGINIQPQRKRMQKSTPRSDMSKNKKEPRQDQGKFERFLRIKRENDSPGDDLY